MQCCEFGSKLYHCLVAVYFTCETDAMAKGRMSSHQQSRLPSRRQRRRDRLHILLVTAVLRWDLPLYLRRVRSILATVYIRIVVLWYRDMRNGCRQPTFIVVRVNVVTKNGGRYRTTFHFPTALIIIHLLRGVGE